MKFFNTEDIKDLKKTSQTTLKYISGSIFIIEGQFKVVFKE